ncbi:esterase-like activity of phytase family protein [Micromonospora narathiwatensis]|uniref:Esterase-like activity of phytase n=1 Tax=Micromonospora narathiwatensis TaxID=299146 RepID=A0A1A8ZR65_9ACTN|nr:esterase-like activity of phytase family protein [Micromonospora narathiwatensis]SBT46371.1 hypothetical protein GA0070621_2593 [Micromonospora narathiwatensis]
MAGVAPSPSPAGGTPLCQVRDSRLTEISGMAATRSGYVVVNDSADEESRRRIFFLDTDCRVVRTLRYPSRPRDTEDLALGRDGTIWIADIGDNRRSRETVAVWRLAPGGDRPVLHRLTYPDGPHDAEALLLTGDGRPLIVTKQGGAAGVYAPTRDPVPGGTVPMTRRGQVRLPGTNTSNPFGFLGRAVVTGAAAAPDGRRVVLRTYADAFEFDVPDGDVVRALTTGTPRIVPLPDEPQGESITYTPDGRFLLTVSETADQPPGTRPTITRYPTPRLPATAPRSAPASASATTPHSAPASASATAATGAPAAAGPGRHGDLAGVLGALVLAGAGLVGVGLLGTARSRRNGS